MTSRRPIPRLLIAILALAVLPLIAEPQVRNATGQHAAPRKMVWFTPGPGTPDMRTLFLPGAPWPNARAQVSVFKFYQGHVLYPTPSYFLPNDYRGLAGVGAFRVLTHEWHKQIAIEVGVVKKQYCSTNGVEEENAIRDAIASIWNIEAAGGRVNYLAFDEPFYAGASDAECGSPDLTPAADRVVHYMSAVKAADPDIAFGLIEPYPYFSASRLAQILGMMRGRGVVFRFLHLDAGVDVMKPAALAGVPADWRYLAAHCATIGTRFGVIVNGDNGDSAALYSNGVMLRLQVLKAAFGDWADMPDDLIFQSWAVNSAGQKVIPPNLPETAPNTATELIDRGLFVLRGPGVVR